MTVYVVTYESNKSKEVSEVFISEENAKRYCDDMNRSGSYWERNYQYEEHEVYDY